MAKNILIAYFSHGGENYIIHRTAYFKKSYIDEITFDHEEFKMWIAIVKGL